MYYVRTHAHTQTSTHTNTHENTRMCTHIPTHLLILQYFSDPNLGGFQETLDFCPIDFVSNYTTTASALVLTIHSSRALCRWWHTYVCGGVWCMVSIVSFISVWTLIVGAYFYQITCRHLVTANDQETSVCCRLTDLVILDLEEYFYTLQYWWMFNIILLLCRWQCVYGDCGSHLKMCKFSNHDQLGI